MYLEKFRLGRPRRCRHGCRPWHWVRRVRGARRGRRDGHHDRYGSRPPLLGTPRLLKIRGIRAFDQILDVTDIDSVTQAERDIVAAHGQCDILVNNAGIAISNHPAETMSDEVWNKVIDVNLNGVFRCCRAFGRGMLERGAGNIVNVGSMSGMIVNRPQEQANYNSSKAAVHHLTRSLATEWASRGVRVNAVAPTYIATEMNSYVYEDKNMYQHWVGGTPMGRLGRTGRSGFRHFVFGERCVQSHDRHNRGRGRRIYLLVNKKLEDQTGGGK